MNTGKSILITGATGYIGGRLIPQLLARGYRLRCLARDPDRLRARAWAGRVEVVRGDVADRSSMDAAMTDCSAAYYLVHSMARGGGKFGEADRRAATIFAGAAESAGIERIIYLGGLGRRLGQPSEHLRSRHEVAEVLRAGRVPVTELRAAMIIGSGSASFEMLRSLVKRLPVMVCPRWVENRTQPIAVRDVLEYLIGCLEEPATAGRSLDIGGPEVLTYKEMMLRYAAILGVRRRIVVVPLLTPRLSAYWANMVTPIPASIAFPLIEGLRSETICEDDDVLRLVPIERVGFDDAVRSALAEVGRNAVETRWADASLPRRLGAKAAFDPSTFPMRDQQVVRSRTAPARLFAEVMRVGGERGWHYAATLWRIRGWIDRALGGVGLRRGRRHPWQVQVGDALDFWRVEDVTPDRRLLLHAEMKVPGDAWLEFGVRARAGDDQHPSELVQTAYFRPSPFWGRLYWGLLYPLHWLIFRGMAAGMVRAAEAPADPAAPTA